MENRSSFQPLPEVIFDKSTLPNRTFIWRLPFRHNKVATLYATARTFNDAKYKLNMQIGETINRIISKSSPFTGRMLVVEHMIGDVIGGGNSSIAGQVKHLQNLLQLLNASEMANLVIGASDCGFVTHSMIHPKLFKNKNKTKTTTPPSPPSSTNHTNPLYPTPPLSPPLRGVPKNQPKRENRNGETINHSKIFKMN